MRTATRRFSSRRLRLSFPAEPARLGVLRRHVARWAAQQCLPSPTVADLQLALGEAVSNGIEHAYPDGRSGTVEVDIEVRPEQQSVVAVQVSDHGRWRPIPFVKGYRGRGLAMIDQLARNLDVAVSESGTRVSFAVPVRS